MKILWLGAGASMSAGYPATRELLAKLDAVIRGGTDVHTEEAWKRFCHFRESSSGIERTILFSPNPEVVLTFPDLLAAALEADDDDIEVDTSRVLRAIRLERADAEDVTVAAKRFEARYSAPERTPLQAGREARRDFLRVLNFYLAHRHYEDGQATNVSDRDALRKELRWMEAGDTVITTNWDTTVERTLLEEGRWTPADGYGFPIELVQGFLADGLRRYAPLPEWIPRSSQVRVLKLHGSFGWITPGLFGPRVSEQGDVYLDYSEFLSQMPFSRNGELVTAYDRRKPELYDGSAEPLYLVPSYLKQLSGVSIQTVWWGAQAALADANELRIVGSSLPQADVAVRALLNPVRFRLGEGSLRATLCNPDTRTHPRWIEFLGSRLKTLGLKTGEYT